MCQCKILSTVTMIDWLLQILFSRIITNGSLPRDKKCSKINSDTTTTVEKNVQSPRTKIRTTCTAMVQVGWYSSYLGQLFVYVLIISATSCVYQKAHYIFKFWQESPIVPLLPNWRYSTGKVWSQNCGKWGIILAHNHKNYFVSYFSFYRMKPLNTDPKCYYCHL